RQGQRVRHWPRRQGLASALTHRAVDAQDPADVRVHQPDGALLRGPRRVPYARSVASWLGFDVTLAKDTSSGRQAVHQLLAERGLVEDGPQTHPGSVKAGAHRAFADHQPLGDLVEAEILVVVLDHDVPVLVRERGQRD